MQELNQGQNGLSTGVVTRVGIIGLTSGARFRLEIAYSGTQKTVE